MNKNIKIFIIVLSLLAIYNTKAIAQYNDTYSISGKFLAQSIAHMASENPGISIYPQIKRNTISLLDDNKLGVRQLYFHALWLEPFMSEAAVDRPENISGEFRDSRFGARGGLSLAEDATKAFGIFWSANKTRIRQGRNSANIDSFEGGGYGGIVRGIFEHKFFISVSRYNVETERFINLNDSFRPETSFYLVGIKHGFESSAELPYYIPKTSTLLIAGAFMASIYNQKIQESGGDKMNLTVEANKYDRMAGYWGARLEGDWWYAIWRMNYFLKGKNNESLFDIRRNAQSNRSLSVEGANNDLISFGLSAGIEKEVERDIFFYASLEGEISRDFYEKSFGVNGGIKYMFADKYSAPFYRAFVRRINPERKKEDDEKRLEQRRQERKLVDKLREQRIEREVSEYEKTLEIRRMAAQSQYAQRQTALKAAQEKEAIETQMRIEQDRHEKAAQDRRKKAMNAYKFKAGFFNAGSAVLLPHAIGNIKTLAADIKGKRFKMITVEGHSDPREAQNADMELSMQRARAAYEELIKNGLPRNKIMMVGFGDKMPIADNGTEEGRAANRRIEIFVE
jgi:outer membrane protein OmpA-like peptidoglycan-associated protein